MCVMSDGIRGKHTRRISAATHRNDFKEKTLTMKNAKKIAYLSCALALLVCLSACRSFTADNSQTLAAPSTAITAMSVQMVALPISVTDPSNIAQFLVKEFRPSLLPVIAATFKNNGIATVETQEIIGKNDLMPTKQQYVLKLSADRYGYTGGAPYAYYKVYLYDMSARKPLWQAELTVSAFQGYGKREAQIVAASILNSLADDGMISMKTGRAVRVDGSEIRPRIELSGD